NILFGCEPPEGTAVETYLCARCVELPKDCKDLLSHPSLAAGNIGYPAMVALVRDSQTGELTGGIHRTWLNENGSGKAPIEKPKMMLGPCDGVVMLTGPMGEDGEIGIGEGIESSLAGGKILGVKTIWAALSAGKLARTKLPPGTKKLHIFADRGSAGED